MLQQPSTVYLNGQFISNDIAFISPDDRGYYFADGVYEVIKYYRNNAFCFEEHIDRLKNSLAGVKINFYDFDKLSNIFNALIEINLFKHINAGVYLQITRGVAPRTHRFPPETVKPGIFARAFPMPSFMDEMKNGVMVMTREDIRWLRCNIKSIALLPNTLLFEEVAAEGAFECFLVRDGNITEATHSNVLAIKNGIVYTHPDSNLILPGVTKNAVLKICNKLSIHVIEEPVGADDIYGFNECFITGTGSEITPVVKIDERVIGNGKPGPITRKLQKEFFKITYETLGGEKISL